MTLQHPPTSVVLAASGLSQLAWRYDLIICDVWGVVHDGAHAFPEACRALTRFRAGGGTVILVSNAPRPRDGVAAMLARMGAPDTAFDAIVTSGDLTRKEVAARPGEPVCHIGPPRDHPIYDGLAVTFAEPENARYIVCTGFDDDETQTPEDYRPLLARAAARGLLMICANPDLVVERGAKLIPCAGAIAALYETLGGQILYAGKPHPPVYEETLRLAAEIRRVPIPCERVLAVGDAIRTDIAGAFRMGLTTLFVARGIHAHELGAAGATELSDLAAWAARQEPRPDVVMETLVW